MLLTALVAVLLLLGFSLVWYSSQNSQPSPPTEPLALDLFGQPVAAEDSVASDLSFPPKPPSRLESPLHPESGANTPSAQTQHMFIGPRQPFEPPEIIAYA